jgi:CubicO group peptidase (beta-lactamase class C family)
MTAAIIIRSMYRRCLLSLLAVALLAPAQSTNPAAAGMDPARLDALKARMREFAQQGRVSGIVTLLQRNGALALLDATGFQDLESKTPMRPDSIFQIMSMTKPVTGVAVMMMVEEGRLRLNDPVELHLPEFRGQMMIQSKTADTRVLVKPPRPITIREVMTHTSGLPGGPPPGIAELLREMNRPLGEAVAIYAQQPLEFAPGARWQYSNTGIATLGRLVEVASGLKFEDFLDQRIFAPLGMKDSHIFLPAAKRPRLAPLYTERDGRLVKGGVQALGGDPLKHREGAIYSGPEYALHSTAADLARFYQMMLNRGTLDGKRILSPASVAIMTADHTPAIPNSGWLPAAGFGLTWEVTRDPLGTLTGLTKGAFHHGGAFGTFGWVDPNRNLVGVFLIQHSGSRADVRDAYLAMAASAILD